MFELYAYGLNFFFREIADFGGGQVVNSDIVSLKLDARTGVSYTNLDPPATIVLQPKQVSKHAHLINSLPYLPEFN